MEDKEIGGLWRAAQDADANFSRYIMQDVIRKLVKERQHYYEIYPEDIPQKRQPFLSALRDYGIEESKWA